jgi:nephrocystin-3
VRNNPHVPVTARQRVVRVFVSSTFQDMQEERETLARETFPELRRRCRERQVEFVAVDLLRGMTEQQADRAEMLPLRLAEVENCRPYFLGILGQRYGYIPECLDPEVVADHLWLVEHPDKSLTELEMLHGVLRDPTSARHALFYFRDPTYGENLSRDRWLDFVSESPAAAQKLDELKARIKSSHVPLREDYADPATLAHMVVEDLWHMIESDFPAGSPMDHLEREAVEQEAFAASRHAFYVPSQGAFRALDEHAMGDGPPLVVTGLPGMGKSSLLANWTTSYRQRHPEDLVIRHFVGVTPHSGHHVAITRRILAEVNYARRTNQDIPDTPERLREAMPLQLATACIKGKLVLVLDGIDMVTDDPGLASLRWLPKGWPKNVRLVVSTRPGPILEALEQREWAMLRIGGFSPEDARRFVGEYFDHFGKTLSNEQLERVTTFEPPANPLYLRTLLEALRIGWSYDNLDSRIDSLLAGKTVSDLMDSVFSDLEATREEGTKGLAGQVTALLWASRNGLYESELLGLLGSPGDPLPHALWSPVYMALQGLLVDRWGILDVMHEDFLPAIQQRFLTDEKTQRDMHVRLAKYFASRKTDDRKVDELPWQLARAQAWKPLHDCITNLGVFWRLSVQARQWELNAYWGLLHDQFDMAAAYQECINRYPKASIPQRELPFILDRIGSFLELNGKLDAAESFYRQALEVREQTLGLEHEDTVANLHDLAEVLRTKGDHTTAEVLLRRALDIQERILGSDHVDTALSMNDLAGLLMSQGRHAEAEGLLCKALAVREKALGPTHADVAVTLDNLAVLYRSKGDHAAAVPVLRKALQVREACLCREHPDMAASARDLAESLVRTGDIDNAQAFFRTSLEIYDEVFGVDWPNATDAVKNLAILLENKGDYEAAEPLLRRLLAIENAVGQRTL